MISKNMIDFAAERLELYKEVSTMEAHPDYKEAEREFEEATNKLRDSAQEEDYFNFDAALGKLSCVNEEIAFLKGFVEAMNLKKEIEETAAIFKF